MFQVVIPTYNRSKLLKRCLDSIRKQTFSDYEVLILDDCSSDDTQEVVKEYTKDERFKYVRFEKNHGHGDKVYKEAQELGLFTRDWIVLLGDDEYFYNALHLQKLQEAIVVNPDANFVGVDCGYGYGEIEVFSENLVALPLKSFSYQDLTLEQKETLQDKIKVVYKTDFLIENDIFNAEQQNKNDSCFEVSYYTIYQKAVLLYVPEIAHIFGITANARRKYVDFYNWIVSVGMVAFQARDKDLAYLHLRRCYSDPSMCLNAFFDWGGIELAGVLSYFVLEEDFPKYLRDFARIYKDKFQVQLEDCYHTFNAMLMGEEEKQREIDAARNVVIYGENQWREQIEKYFVQQGKKIVFVADDYKEGYKSYQDILREKDNIDLVFIASGSPKIIFTMLRKLKSKENGIKVATLITRDEGRN